MRKTALLFVIPLVALAACSGPAEPEREAPAAPGAGLSLDGPMMATPGLWMTTTTANGRKAFGVNRTCVDAASQKADPLGQEGASGAGCKPPQRRPIAGGFAYDLVCEQQGLKTIVSGEVKGDSKHVVMTSTTRMIDPQGGDAMPPATVVVQSDYVGPCPAGMKPGDFVQDGVAAQ